MFLDDQNYTQFCGLSTFDAKCFYKQTAFNKTCNWNARRAVKPDIKRRTSRCSKCILLELKALYFRTYHIVRAP